jgi:hypothetical protein
MKNTTTQIATATDLELAAQTLFNLLEQNEQDRAAEKTISGAALSWLNYIQRLNEKFLRRQARYAATILGSPMK